MSLARSQEPGKSRGPGNIRRLASERVFMSERIEHFDFDAFERPRRTSPYPIAQWCDGSVWRVWRGTDYEGPVKHMQSRLHYYAVGRRMWVRTRAVRDGEREGIVFQFVPREVRR